MNKLLYSGPTARAPEYQCLRYLNHTKSWTTYWHRINLLTSPFFYHIHLETSLRPFHIITRLTLYIENTSVSSENHGPTPRTTRSRSSAQRRKSPGLCANQMASSWHACLMSHITPCAPMTTRLLITFLQVT